MTTAYKKRCFIRPEGLSQQDWRKLYRKLLQRELRLEKPELEKKNREKSNCKRRGNPSVLLRRKELRNANLEEYRKKGRERAQKYSAKAQEYKKANPDQYRATSYRWVLKNRAKIANNRGMRRSATTLWADKEKTKMIYQICEAWNDRDEIGFHVDHIIPINGKNVCGLHIPENLQILPAPVNQKKGNKVDYYVHS